MSSDLNVRVANLQNIYETLKNEIGELKKFISAFEMAFQGHILNLTSRINNNNDLHVSNFNKSISYLDDTSNKIKEDIKSFEKVKDSMADIHEKTLENKISLEFLDDKIDILNHYLSEKEEKIQQQQQILNNHEKSFHYINNQYNELNDQFLKTKKENIEILMNHEGALSASKNIHKLTSDNFCLIHDRINSIVSAIESLHASIEKYYLTHCSDLNTLEKKLTEYIDKKIVSLPKPPERFETSPQVLEELKVLGLNIKNLVIQKNDLEISSKKQEYQINNLTQQIQSIKG